MSSKRVWRIGLAAALLATLAAAWFAPNGKDQGVVLSERASASLSTINPSTAALASTAGNGRRVDGAHVLPIQRREDTQEVGISLFVSQPVHVALEPANDKRPVARPPPTPPPPPQAPPLPFQVLGRYDDRKTPAVFLQFQERSLVAHVGDIIDEQYKVERIDGDVMELRYLPLNQVQTLELRGSH